MVTSSHQSTERKHTDHYLNYKSNHHPRILSGLVNCLSSRATSICNSAILDKELAHLKTTFLANGYPISVINTNINCYRKSKRMNSITENESKLLVLPYIKGISGKKIERICRPLNIKVNFQTTTTLRKLLVPV